MGELGGFSELMIFIASIIYVCSRCAKPDEDTKEAILGKDYEKVLHYINNNELNKAKDKKSKKGRYEIEEEVLNEANDGIKLQARIMKVDIFSKLFLKDYHEKLLPLIYMNQAAKRLNLRETKTTT